MHVHLRFALDLADELYNLLGERIGSRQYPIVTLAKEDYITLILRQLRYCGQRAAHLAHLSKALMY